MDDSRSSEILSSKFDESWARRKRYAETWNANLAKGLVEPGRFRQVLWFFRSISAGKGYHTRRKELEKRWREVEGRKEASIALALNDALGWFFWTGGMFKVNF